MSSLNEDDVRRLYQDEGKSLRVVAKALGTNLATLSRFMKKFGIPTRSKGEAQKNYLKTNEHQMRGRTHSEETRRKISSGVGEFWDNLTEEEARACREKIGDAWRKRWAAMSDIERQAMMDELAIKSRLAQGKGSRLEHYIAQNLRDRGYVVEERTTNYTTGKDFEVDLGLPAQGIAIEVDGPTHFMPIHGDEALAKQQERDGRKDEMILANGYHVLRIRDNNGPLSRLRIDRIEEKIKEIGKHGKVSVWYIN